MFGNASQGGEQADQLYLGMLGSLIAFLWSVAEYLHHTYIIPSHSSNFDQVRRYANQRKKKKRQGWTGD